MSLFIRCQWMPPAEISPEDRTAEAAALLGDQTLAKIVGTNWYHLASSKAKALAKPVLRDDLVDIVGWRRGRLIAGRMMYAVDLWNGCDYPKSANLSIAIHVPAADLDTIILSGLDVDYLSLSDVSWETILGFADRLASKFGGLTVVASNELLDRLAERFPEIAQHAAYAAFWGVDRSGHNPLCRRVGKDLPTSIVACDSWADLKEPDDSRIRTIAETLARHRK